MSYTPKNNFNLQLKRTDAGEVGFRKKLLKDVACCDETDYKFQYSFNPDSVSAGNGIVLYIEGGCADFTWAITGSDFTLDDVTTSVRYNIVRADNATAANVSETLTVTDSCGTAISITIICCDATNCCDLSDYDFTYSGDDPIELDLDIYEKLTFIGGCSPFYWLSDHEDVSFSEPRYTNQPDNRVKALAGDAYQGNLTVEDECGTSVVIGYTVCCNDPDYEFYMSNTVTKIELDTTETITVVGGCPPFEWHTDVPELSWATDKTTGRTNDLSFSRADDGTLTLGGGKIYVTDSCGESTLDSDSELNNVAIVEKDITNAPWALIFCIWPTDCYLIGDTASIELQPSWSPVLSSGASDDALGVTTTGINPLNVTVPSDFALLNIELWATMRADGYHWHNGATVSGSSIAVIEEGAKANVYSTGINSEGQLGLGDTTQRTSFTSLPDFSCTDIAASGYHTLFISDEALYATGANLNGSLGVGDTIQKNSPTVTNLTSGVSKIAAAEYHSIALIGSALYVVGSNVGGELGLGDNTDRSSFVLVGSSYKAISGGMWWTIAINTSGVMYSSGKWRPDDYSTRNTFALVDGGGTWEKTFGQMGGYSGAHAITPGGALYFFGDSTEGVAGNGSSSNAVYPFTSVDSGWSKVSHGYNHAFGIKTDGTLWSTGLNTNGQLGHGDTTQRYTFTQIGSATNWTEVDCGESHSAAVNSVGEVWTAGSNLYGQLGHGDTTQRTTLTKVAEVSGATKVVCGAYHTVILIAE